MAEATAACMAVRPAAAIQPQLQVWRSSTSEGLRLARRLSRRLDGTRSVRVAPALAATQCVSETLEAACIQTASKSSKLALRPRRRRRKACVGDPTTKGERHLRSYGRRAYWANCLSGPPPFKRLIEILLPCL